MSTDGKGKRNCVDWGPAVEIMEKWIHENKN